MPMAPNIGQEAEQRLLAAAQTAGMWPRNLLFTIREYLRGGSCREIAYRAGVSFNYVRKINKLAVLVGVLRNCLCGRPMDHSGWCQHRVKRDAVYLAHVLTRARRDVDKPSYLVKIEKATSHILWIELRNEIRQELSLKVLEGAITEQDIRQETKRVQQRLTTERYKHVSLTEPLLESQVCSITLSPAPPIDPDLFRRNRVARNQRSMNGKKAAATRWGKRK